MTINEYIQRAENSETAIKEGKVIDIEELDGIVESWK